MPITEFAILAFGSPPDSSDSTLRSLFLKLSSWQSECSGFPVLFFVNLDDPLQVHLVTGWESVEAHEAWIQGERNQELLRVFAPYVDIPKTRMVHVDFDFEVISRDAGWMVVERYGEEVDSATFESESSSRLTRSLFGKDLAQDGDAFYFQFGIGECPGAGEPEARSASDFPVPVERWSLKNFAIQ